MGQNIFQGELDRRIAFEKKKVEIKKQPLPSRMRGNNQVVNKNED